MKDNVLIGEMFSDTELQWFRGGPRVTEVTHLATEDDIVGEESTDEVQ